MTNIRAATKTAPARPTVVPKRTPVRRFPPQRPGEPNIVPFKRPGRQDKPVKQPVKPVQPSPAKKPGKKPNVPPKPSEPQRIWKPKHPEPRKPASPSNPPTMPVEPGRKISRSHTWQRKSIPRLGLDPLGLKAPPPAPPGATGTPKRPGKGGLMHTIPRWDEIHRWNVEFIQADRQFRYDQWQRRTLEQVQANPQPYGPPQQTARSIKMDLKNHLEKLRNQPQGCIPSGGLAFSSHYTAIELRGEPIPPGYTNPTGATHFNMWQGGDWAGGDSNQWVVKNGYGQKSRTRTKNQADYWNQRFAQGLDAVRRVVWGQPIYQEADNTVTRNGTVQPNQANITFQWVPRPIYRWINPDMPNDPLPWQLPNAQLQHDSTFETPGRDPGYFDNRTQELNITSIVPLDNIVNMLQTGYTTLEWGVGVPDQFWPGRATPDTRWRFPV